MIEIKAEENGVSAYDGEKRVGRCSYRKDGSVITIFHTEVDKAYGGRGIALSLLDSIAGEARKKGYRIVSECSFVSHALQKHPDKYSDIMA